MLVNKNITATLMIERTDELKTMEKIYLSEEKLLRKYKRKKWIALIFNTFIALNISTLFIDAFKDVKSVILATIFTSVFSYAIQEFANIYFIKYIRRNNININTDNFTSNTCVMFRDKITDIINAEMKKEKIKNFEAQLNSVLTTPENYQVDITYPVE
jgi:hypothetical protein